MPYTYPYPRPAVTVDVVVAVPSDSGGYDVLLVKRGKEPFKGKWALPGGFLDLEEELEEAAARELAEETGVTGVALEELGAFGRIGRDPRGRTVSIAYLAVLPGRPDARAGDDAAEVGWFPLDRPPDTAFDHEAILARARARLGEGGGGAA